MYTSKTTNQRLLLLLSGMLLILILPSRTMTAPSRPAKSSCTQAWSPQRRLLVGVEVLKTYENRTSSPHNNTSIPVPSGQMDMLDLLCDLVILHELTEKVDLNLSRLAHQNVKDGDEWLMSFIHGDDTNNASSYERQLYEHCLQPHLENITQFDAQGRIEDNLSGCGDPPTSELLQAMWIYSNNGTLGNVITCSSFYDEVDCKNGSAAVTGGACPICV